MRQILACLLTVASLVPHTFAQTRSAPPPQPKLVLLIAVDQLRYDYLARFNRELKGGLRMLLDRGANFVNAHLEHYPTVTAVGHATMMTGATPAVSGIIGNDWYDREAGRQVTSVDDPGTRMLGGPDRTGSSPHRLLVSTVGDELKRAHPDTSKVIGISFKDRSAILPAGRMADAAYWFVDETGSFVTSTWYMQQLPEWVTEFNNSKPADRYAGRTWQTAGPGLQERKIPAEAGTRRTAAVYSSPFGNELLESFAERTIEAEKLGQRGGTDVLTVSFSSNDAVGHSLGPDAPEVGLMTRSADEQIGKLLTYVDKTVGLRNTIVMLTSDHGVSPSPEVLGKQRMPGGRLIKGDFFDPVREALEKKYGPGKWLISTAGSSPYLNHALMAERGIDPAEARRIAAEAIRNAPHVTRVYTREQLLDGRFAADRFDLRVARSYFARRSGDLEVLLDPYWIRGRTVATHGSAWNYDSQIPLILMGPMFQPGRYYTEVALNDLAPTVAAMLDLAMPSGAVGRVLTEALRPVRSQSDTPQATGLH